jgi:hypothetical protein
MQERKTPRQEMSAFCSRSGTLKNWKIWQAFLSSLTTLLLSASAALTAAPGAGPGLAVQWRVLEAQGG